ncbi:N-formylglutamate amidohydrolase [Bradyrhizobium sp. 83012]|uniref:N-formylglutamate amidohydrolase n=1 Tax=Bradyrhizobium aeschynomenes TaxID=2734909 RepID=A0ABX2CBA5_9BRAD|nr:N-formylglutamate amidohydrolase [Bradyrhizobium aeschynomenes]NPU64760.1 N-formylglutamate amidohydrolase [Bradyrhizobium aeschynomenes]
MKLPDATDTARLLQGDEVPPVYEQNADGASALVFTCDHYGRLLPRALGDLGLDESELERHIAWDIGIAGVAEQVSRALDAHLLAQRYSRLVIDCNRWPQAPNAIPMISERTTIPGNEGLTHEDAELRRRAIFVPYHDRITAVLDARKQAGRPTILVSLHSFTPVYAGIARPWHIGTLYQHDKVLPPLLLKALRAEPDLVVGDNQPYAVGDNTDYTIPVHGEGRGLINSGIEIRQNEIAEPEGQQVWAERLIRILGEIESELRGKGLA